MPADTMHIGEVAERCGLSLRTVRYYEEQGLITPGGRSEGGFRLYTEEQVQRLLVIMQMKPLGFSVAEMRDLLHALDTLADPDTAAGPREAAEGRLAAYAAAAEDRCARLREDLARAERFVGRLRAGDRTLPRVAGSG
jgi:DNA-binding transcriptional MerR regulator